jgi:hypothetical protein
MYGTPMDELIGPETKMLLPMLYDVTFVSDMVCSAPKNLLFKRVYEVGSYIHVLKTMWCI